MSKKPLKKLMWAGYATILRAIQKGPKASEDLEQLTGIGITMIRQTLNRMHDMRLVHIGGWEQRCERRQYMVLWAFGPGIDAPHPLVRPGRPRNRHARYAMRPSLVAFAHIVRTLADPISINDLADEVGSTSSNIARLMVHCRRIGLVRIADWRQRKEGMGRPAMLLQISDGEPNAPRPKRMSESERCRRYRQRTTGRQHMLAMIHATAAPLQAVA